MLRNLIAKFHEIWHLICVYQRIIDFSADLKQRSIFLLGARQTGKSTLLRTNFPDAKVYNLLAADTYRQLSATPEQLRQSLTANDRLIIIDEIQKLPNLLDEIHLMIEEHKQLRFILTGSSARKLRRGGANLLAGRARTNYLFPLVYPEYGPDLINQVLRVGALPAVLDSDEPFKDLNEYVGGYLQEEIRAEALTRSIEAFSRFLAVAGLSNGEQLNFTKVGNDAQVPPRTVREFFHVLDDTLIGYQLPPFTRTKSRKPVATSKFYFFDIGVAHSLQQVDSIPNGTSQFGRALEHLVANEIRAFLSYSGSNRPLTYWRSTSQIEVDFVIDDSIAIEVKGTGRVSERDAKGLLALEDDLKLKRKIIVCTEANERRLDNGVEVLPIGSFLEQLWANLL